MSRFINLKLLGQSFIFAWFGLLALPEASAHGDMDWNDFTVDSKTDSIDTAIQHMQKVIADIILERRPVTSWPDTELSGLSIELEHLHEEMEYMLAYFKEAGVRIQLSSDLKTNPRAGRAVTATSALETAVALIEYMGSLPDHRAFEDELHEGGKGAYMYDLLESYKDKMGVYQELVKVLSSHSH